MRKHNFPNFGFSTILLTFAMICIVTFSALAFVTANSDYRLSKRVADNNSAYYTACEEVYDELAEIDAMLLSAYDNSLDRQSYFDSVSTVLSSDSGMIVDQDNPGIIYFEIDKTATHSQTLQVKISINYPTHKYDTFYKINEWKLNTDTSFSEDDSLNLFGGN